MSEPLPPNIVYEDPAEIAAVARRRKAQRRLTAFAILVILIGGGYWYAKTHFPRSFESVASLESKLERSALQEVQQNIATPPPLRASKSTPVGASTTLTKTGVVERTNLARAENGSLPALLTNATLDAIAAARLADMFQKQYFAHVAPDGGSAQTVAKAEGYDYIALGENLALGNFAGDKGVVDAWMASPGHRANILNAHYTQIGVAAKKGTYEGETVWIAVQIFGRPSSDCPPPNPDLKATIDAAQASISSTNAELAADKAAIDAMRPQSGSAYNAKVEEYNALVRQYNALVAQTKAQIDQYNGQVQTYNRCLGG